MSDGYYIMEFVDDIAKIIDTASKVPMTGKVMLDKRELLDIIYSVQDHLPEEIRNAQLIINQKDRILQNAVAQKEQMLYEAKRDSDNLRRDTMEMMKNRVQNHDYVKEAKEVAEKLIAEANENATAIRQDAENYVENDVESDLAKLSSKMSGGDIAAFKNLITMLKSGNYKAGAIIETIKAIGLWPIANSVMKKVVHDKINEYCLKIGYEKNDAKNCRERMKKR